MKLFEIPMLVTSLVGLCLLSGLDAPPVYADFMFGEPVNLESVIPVLDGVHDVIDCFSQDGLEMYIESDRSGGYGEWDLWASRRASTDEDWGPLENLGTVFNTAKSDAAASISADGLTLYFISQRPGGYGSADIYMTTRATKNDPWGQAVNMGPKINSSNADLCPWISADGLELYFESYLRAGGYGGDDIYVARRATMDDPWGEPVNLGPVVNSAYEEHGLSLSPDGLLMFFADRYLFQDMPRPGGYGSCDIWMTRRASLSDPWQAPVNLGPQVNGSAADVVPRISLDGNMLYFCSNRGGNWNNYQAPILPVVDFYPDWSVEMKDFSKLAQYWGQDEPSVDIGPMPWGDGVVDIQDVAVLVEYWLTEIPDPALLAHWKLDETEGNIAHDSAGDHDGGVSALNPLWQPAGGKVNGALQFDGLDDGVGTPFVLNPAEEKFSVFAWVKGGAAGQVIISQVVVANWLLADPAEGKLMTELKSTGRSGRTLISDTVITDGGWHRVGLAWDGSNRILYVDDVEVAKDTQDDLAGSTGGLYIGAGKNLEGGSFWSGQIDDVRVYERAVTP